MTFILYRGYFHIHLFLNMITKYLYNNIIKAEKLIKIRKHFAFI